MSKHNKHDQNEHNKKKKEREDKHEKYREEKRSKVHYKDIKQKIHPIKDGKDWVINVGEKELRNKKKKSIIKDYFVLLGFTFISDQEDDDDELKEEED